jgi:hypothetical protein
MKTKNFNLTFYLKKPKGYESGILPVYLRIAVDGKRSEATIGRGIEPENWDEKRGKARGIKENAKSLNAHLESILAKLKRIHTRMLDSEEEITADTLRNEFDGKGGYSGDLDQCIPCALEHRFVLKEKNNQINRQYVNMVKV